MRYAVNTSLLAVQTKKRKIWYALDVKHSNLDRKMNGAYSDYIYMDSLHTETAFKNLSKFHNICVNCDFVFCSSFMRIL